jgi:hypothetical protein
VILAIEADCPAAAAAIVYLFMRRIAIGVAALLATVCSPPAQPTPQPNPGGTVPPTPTVELHDLTLEVFEDTREGPRPVADVRGVFWFHRPGDSYSTGDGFTTDADGRKVFPHLPHGTEVRIRADKGYFYQLCCVGATVTAATTLRLELVNRGSRPSVLTSPVLSGMVYTETPQGRQPVVDVAIGYQRGCAGLIEVYARTDEQGRYLFCRLPPGPGCVFMYWGEDSEFQKKVPVTISGDLVLDIDFGK